LLKARIFITKADLSMVHQERLEIGEKCFVSGIMAVLATEAGLTVITSGMHFSWVGLLLGITGFCLTLVLANRLYTGSRQACKLALTWIGFQILYATFTLLLMVSSARGAEIAQHLGAPALWPVLFKVLVYLGLGWILVRMPTVREFFAEKRGEPRAHDLIAQKAAIVQEEDQPLNWTASQNEGVRDLAQYVRLTVGALIALGAVQMLASVVVFDLHSGSPQAVLLLVQGLLIVVLGMAMGAPSNEIRLLASPEEQTQGQFLRALGSLIKFYKLQVLVGVLLTVVIVARFVITHL
jgi:hypothetical protein